MKRPKTGQTNSATLYVRRSTITALKFLCIKTPEQGAATTLHVAFEPKADAQNGFYFANSKVRKVGKQAKDSSQAKTLWSWTENRLAEFYK